MRVYFEKVANDLQMAHDMYRQQVDRVNDITSRLNATHDRYKEVTPKYVGPTKAGLVLGGTGLGALAGGLLGRKANLGFTLGVNGGLLGMLGGAVGAQGVDMVANHQVPERRILSKQVDNLSNQYFDEDQRLDGRQADLLHAGLGNPAGVRALLDPTDEYDRFTDAELSNLLRNRRGREEELEDERLNKMRSESAQNQSNARINNHMLLNEATKR